MRQVFDYAIPADRADPMIGARVRVPFGKSKRVGVVLALADAASVDRAKLRELEAVLDEESLINQELLALLDWAAQYYHHPVGEALSTALPSLLRQGRPSTKTPSTFWRLTAEGRRASPGDMKRAPKQAALVERFNESVSPISETELATLVTNWRPTLRALAKRGWIERTVEEDVVAKDNPTRALSREQSEAIESITKTLNRFHVTLLEGVTGSGKTEVYLRLIDAVVRRGQQALLLVPEIGLTPQTLQRVKDAIPGRVGTLHSGLGDRERLDNWLSVRDGTLPVLVGTRSAVFAPFKDLGLIIIDEEHDLSYKQQDGFRYSARDLAIRRAQQIDAPVVLGSATPSLESLNHALTGRYHHSTLKERIAGAALPRLHIVDLRGQRLFGQLSPRLIAAVQQTVHRNEQALLFVNQRGYAPVLMCHECGWTGECARCDARLVWHRADRRLRCHHCYSERPAPRACPECGKDSILPIGIGTERIVEQLEAQFPTANVARIDRDSTRRRGTFESMVQAITDQEVHILVGTQMLAKGHHFPNVTLVGIVDVDGGLFGADFRAPERMSQLIVQVSGRAGRGRRSGDVYLQTHHPDNPLLRRLIERGYGEFARSALAERQGAHLPPFAALALLRAESAQAEPPATFLTEAKERLRTMSDGQVTALGPVPAPMERRAGRLRSQLLVQARERGPLQRLLKPWVRALETLKSARRVRWSIDVDPQDMT